MPNQEPMRDPITNLFPNADQTPLRVLRRAFYNDVLRLVPVEPREDLQRICRAWMDVTEADWVWLWLKHEDGKKCPWELTAVACRNGKQENYIPTRKEFLSIESEESVAEYVAALERPLLVDNIEAWQKPRDRRIHRVIALDELKSRGCCSFVSVPLLFPKQKVPGDTSPFSNIRNIRGLVCSHFTTLKPAAELQDEESYKLMGHATTTAIIASFAANQLRVLVEMDALATKYLTKGGRIDENRKEYLKEVICLIQDHLLVDRVSVFYKTLLDEDVIECIASTGLYLNGGNDLLADKDLSTARYRKGEGLTGEVFARGIPYVFKIGPRTVQPDGTSRCKSSENPNDNLPEYKHSWVCHPISTAVPGPQNEITHKPVGVLRCIGNKSILTRVHERNFDPIQLQTLNFIASQIAPVLETMAIHIKRERSITIIKHELDNPMGMISSEIEKVNNDLKQGRDVPRFWFSNVKAALLLAKNLTGSLIERQAFVSEDTLIEADIVARLREALNRYAWVEKRMSVDYENIRDTFPRIRVDRDLIERGLTNLLVNAIKYGYTETNIVVSGEISDAGYLLHVSNYGMGVEPSEAELIFEGNYRSPRVISERQGLGLGLKIARAAMRKHGGDLVLTSCSNPTIFTMIFPKRLATSKEYQ